MDELYLKVEVLQTKEFYNRLRKRNKEAFKILYENYKLPIYNLVFSIVKDNDRTADILQDTFIKVIKNINQLKEIEKIRYWIFRIAINLTLNSIRKDKKLNFSGENLDFLSSYAQNTLQQKNTQAETRQLYYYILELVEVLPIKQKVVFTLKYIESFKESEISEILDIPVGTVKSRLNNARNRIRERLGNGLKQF